MKSFRVCTLLCCLVFTLAVLAAWPSSAFGGAQAESQGKAEAVAATRVSSIDDQVKNLTEKLDLTDDQQSRVRSILEDERREMQDQMKSPYLSREDNRSALGRIQVKTNSKIRDLLSGEQKTKFDQMEKERRSRSTRENNHGNGSSQ